MSGAYLGWSSATHLIEGFVETECDDACKAAHPNNRVKQVEFFPRSLCRICHGTGQPARVGSPTEPGAAKTLRRTILNGLLEYMKAYSNQHRGEAVYARRKAKSRW